MNYVITLTPQAKADLGEIFKYIAVQLQSIQSASGQLERLEKAIASLSHMPERFRVYDESKWRRRNLGVRPVDHYLIFYIPDREKSTVTIVRIMYDGRDVDRQLRLEENDL